MKRGFWLTLVSMIVTTAMLGGCGVPKGGEPVTFPSDEEVAAFLTDEATLVASEEVSEEEADDSMTATEQAAALDDYASDCPSIEITNNDACMRDEDDHLIITYDYPTYSVSCGTYATDSLQSALNEISDSLKKDMEQEVNSIKVDLADNGAFAEVELSTEYPFASVTKDVYLTRVDSRVISQMVDCYYNYGGAHPFTKQLGFNLDTKTGQTVTLEDIISNMDGFKEYAVNKAKDEIQRRIDENEEYFFEDYEAELESILEYNWYLDAAGIEIVFGEEVLAPHAAGIIKFCMPYNEIFQYMKPEYIPNVEDGFLKMPYDAKCQATMIDGMLVGIGFDYIECGNTKTTLANDYFVSSAYLCKRQEGIYVMLTTSDGTDYSFAIYDVRSGSIDDIFVASDRALMSDSISPDSIALVNPATDEKDIHELGQILAAN